MSVFNSEAYKQEYEAKKAGLERLLGPMHHLVGHAVVAYDVGGPVDMYYFTECSEGTAFATMELIQPDGTGPKPNRIGTYELVAFTRHPFSGEDLAIRKDTSTPFDAIERRMNGIFTTIGHFSTQAVLNPGETCEVPVGEDGETANLVLDEYTKYGHGLEYRDRRHCLLICIEVFHKEMDFARERGSAALLKKLKAAGHYPRSDLDRASVV